MRTVNWSRVSGSSFDEAGSLEERRTQDDVQLGLKFGVPLQRSVDQHQPRVKELGGSTMRALMPLIALLSLGLAACDETSPVNPGPQSFLSGKQSVNVFTQLAAGWNHACALRSDGVVQCWGANAYGEAPATRNAITGRFTYLSVGADFTCAVRNDGVAECWGRSQFGEAPATRAPSSGSFVQVSGGLGHSCALRSDGVAECWGASGIDFGQAPPTRSASVGTFSQVRAGNGATCGLRSDGAIECWGLYYYNSPPLSDIAPRFAQVGTFTQFSYGHDNHTCALRDDGAVECWLMPGVDVAGGGWEFGQAPSLRTASSGSFVQVSGLGSHSCALRTDGAVECWGDNSYGQAPAIRRARGGSFVQVSAGIFFTCALQNNTIVVECWGNDGANQAPSRYPTPAP